MWSRATLSLAARRWQSPAVHQARCLSSTAAACGGSGTYARQGELPKLPVPTLEETIPKYLRTVEALATEEELKTTAAVAEAFARMAGPKLQARLEEHARCADTSWLEKWWDNMYLQTRDPNPINVNYAFTYKQDAPASASATFSPQVDRAARLIAGALEFKGLVETETLEPDVERSGAPLCMHQTARIFNHARIPAVGCDLLLNYGTPPAGLDGEQHFATRWVGSNPSHISVVAPSGHMYSLTVLDRSGAPLSTTAIAAGIDELLTTDASCQPPPASLCRFTGAERDKWARMREMTLKADSSHRSTLGQIDSGIFVLTLDPRSPADEAETTRFMLHGQGGPMWFDKHQLVVCADGTAGWNFEHAPGDGTTSLRMFEYAQQHSLAAAGTVTGAADAAAMSQLPVNMTPEIIDALEDCHADLDNVVESLQQSVLAFEDFGAGRSKELRMSPDAYAQVAMQLAIYRLRGGLVGTYESGATRNYLHGRTETVRSATVEARDMARAMDDASIDNATKKQLILDAGAAHVNYLKMAKVGKGVDRHLMGLKLCLKENESLPDLYSDPMFAFSGTWRLSTSNCTNGSLALFSFGPVCADGLGVGYTVEKDRMSFSVSSFEPPAAGASAGPSATDFTTEVAKALKDMETVLAN